MDDSLMCVNNWSKLKQICRIANCLGLHSTLLMWIFDQLNSNNVSCQEAPSVLHHGYTFLKLHSQRLI